MKRRVGAMAPSAKVAVASSGKQQTVSPEIGTSGLKRSGGYVQEEFHRDLRGARGMKVYREMRDNSAIIGACLGAIEMLIRQVTWFVEPASSSQEDKKLAEHVDTCRGDMSHTWAEMLGEILSMLPFGWSYHELVYKRRLGDVNDPTENSRYTDGLIGWRKIPLRAQESLLRWDLDANGGIQAMWQSAAPDYKPKRIPIEVAALFRAKSEKNSPEGRSILRNGYSSYYFGKRIQEIEGIGIERDLAGMPVFKIPAACMRSDATPEQATIYANAKEIVTSIRRDEIEGAVVPSDRDQAGNMLYELTLLSAGGERQFDTTKIIERYERRIAMTMLADFVLMGHENVGSFALSSDKTALFAVALGGWLDVIRDVFNLHAIPRLMAMNGWPRERSPKLQHGDVEAQSLAALGDYISKLAGAGYRWNADEGVDAHLRRVAGLPRRAKGVTLYDAAGKPLELPSSVPGAQDEAA